MLAVVLVATLVFYRTLEIALLSRIYDNLFPSPCCPFLVFDECAVLQTPIMEFGYAWGFVVEHFPFLSMSLKFIIITPGQVMCFPAFNADIVRTGAVSPVRTRRYHACKRKGSHLAFVRVLFL
jgi:hypothetical protein